MAFDNPEDDPIIEKLASIDVTLKALLKLAQQRQAKARTATVADDRDLDSKWGDPKVNFNPRDWSGPSFKGRRMSECDLGFLDMLAETFDYFADKAEETGETYNGKLVAPYKRKDAARARGWAARIRDGKVPATATANDDDWGRRDEEEF